MATKINFSGNKRDPGFKNSTLAITAVGTTQATATTHIADESFYNVIGTCTNAAHGVSLPKRPRLGVPYVVKNDGAHMASIFCAASGSSSTVDGLAAGTAFILANNGAEASFVASQGTPLAADAMDVVWNSFGKSGEGVIATTAAVTLLPSIHYDTKVFVSQADTYAITIPDPEDAVGMKISVQNKVEGANAVTISSGSADLSGIILLGDAAGVVKVVDQDTTLTMVATHCQIGDVATLISDGVNWSCMVMSQSLDANDGWTVA